MKKIFTLCVVALMAVTTVKAQHEIGAVVGGMNGLSYKYWFFDMYDFTINPNVLYHFDLPANFKLYCGGGVNLGLISDIENTDPDGINGKFGVNGALGAAYEIGSAPIVLALDFRPGYGLGFAKADYPHTSFFDWKLAFAVRYKL